MEWKDMAMLNKLRLRLRALFFKSKMEDELDEEVRFHLEREIEENIARGMTPEEARYAAAYWDVSGGNGMVFGSSQTAERLQFSIVTRTFFSILGVQPTIGRTFSESEDTPGGGKVFL